MKAQRRCSLSRKSKLLDVHEQIAGIGINAEGTRPLQIFPPVSFLRSLPEDLDREPASGVNFGYRIFT